MTDFDADLLDFAREGIQEPFVSLFSQPDGVNKFLAIRDEYTQANPLHMVSANGHIELLKYLIEKLETPENRKKAVTAANDSGNTPLHWAALNGSLDAVKILVEAGADPLQKNLAGIDACYQADSADQNEVANYLYSIASLDDLDEEGESTIASAGQTASQE